MFVVSNNNTHTMTKKLAPRTATLHRYAPGAKERLEQLAKAQGQTLTGYVNAILTTHLQRMAVAPPHRKPVSSMGRK